MRECFNCSEKLPPETKHVVVDEEVYCVNCVDVEPFTVNGFYIAGEWVGDSYDGDNRIIEDYEDEYDGE